MLCTSSLVVQFSKINSLPNPAPPVRSSTVSVCAVSLRQPIYYTTFRSVCQEVFEKFFEVFFGSFFQSFKSSEKHIKPLFRIPLTARLRHLARPVSGALDYYTTFLSICQGVFEKFFEVFLKPSTNRKSVGTAPRFGRSNSIPLFPPFVKVFLQNSFDFGILSSRRAKTNRKGGENAECLRSLSARS